MKSFEKTISAITAFTILSSTWISVSAAEITKDDIMIPINMSLMYNMGNIYTSIKTELGSAGYAGAFYYDDFISSEKHTWKNEWTDGMTDNVLVHDDVEFNMRVIDHKKYNNQASCVFWNNGKDVYENVDIGDGFYKSIELLLNSDRPTTAEKRIGVKLNYSDGTERIYEHKINYFANGGTSVFESTATSNTWKEGEALTSTGKISHLSIDVDATKELESFDIINDKFDFQMNSDGTYKTDENGKVLTSQASSTNRSRLTHTAAIYAITLVQNEELINKAKEEKAKALFKDIYDAIDALGDIDDLHYSQKADVDNITKLIKEVETLGFTADTSTVENFDKYLKALDKIEEVKVMEAQESIKNLIDALGDIGSLTLDDEEKVENITKEIEKVRADGVEISADTISNYENYTAALKRIDELKIEKKLQDISDKITALGDIDSLTAEDGAKLDEIQAMIDAATAEGIEVSKDTVPNYDDYKAAINKIKSLTPVVVPFDMSEYFNCGDIYSSTIGFNGSAGYAGSFYYPAVIEKEEWEKEWGEGVIDNYISVLGTRFKMRVLDRDTNKGDCVFKNTPTESVYTTIDFEDGNYGKIYMLENSDVQTNPAYKKIGLKINYSDGTFDLYDFSNPYFPNINSKEGFTAPGSGNPTSGTGGILYREIKTDITKTLTDMQVLNENYDFVLNEDGSFKYDEDGDPAVVEYGSSRYNRHHSATIYAISLEMPYSDYMSKVTKELNESEELLSERIEMQNGRISAVTEGGRNLYYKMHEYFDFIGDAEYEAGFKNYNLIKDAIPSLSGGSFTESDDTISAEISFDKDMGDLTGKIAVKCANSEIKDFTLTQNGSKAVITFPNQFSADKYKVVVKKDAYSDYGEDFVIGSDQSYSFKTTDSMSISSIQFTGDDGKEIEKLSDYTGEKINLMMKFSNTASKDKNYFILICTYDENGVLVGAEREVGTLQKGRSKTIDKSIDKNNADKLKIIMLDSAGTMKTVLNTVEK